LKCNAIEPSIAARDVPIGTINYNKMNHKDDIYYCFNMWSSPDGWPYLTDEFATQGASFFFSVTGFQKPLKRFDMRYNCDVYVPQTLRIHFKNIINHSKLLTDGYMPVYLEVDNLTYNKLITGTIPFYR
jgi:hypothetical protein